MTVTVKHSVVTGAGSNPHALVDGPAWDAAHVVTGLENVQNVDTTNATNITSGTLNSARLPTLTSANISDFGTASSTVVQGAAGTATPAMDGSAAVGTSQKWAHEDHTHPVDTSRAGLSSSNTFTQTNAFSSGLTANLSASGYGLITLSGATGTAASNAIGRVVVEFGTYVAASANAVLNGVVAGDAVLFNHNSGASVWIGNQTSGNGIQVQSDGRIVGPSGTLTLGPSTGLGGTPVLEISGDSADMRAATTANPSYPIFSLTNTSGLNGAGGSFYWNCKNSGGTVENACWINGGLVTATAGSEEGLFDFSVMANGAAPTPAFTVRGTQTGVNFGQFYLASGSYMRTYSPATSQPTIIADSSSAFTVNTGSNAALATANTAVFVFVADRSLGHAAIYMGFPSGGVILVSAFGGVFVASTTTPAAGHASLAWNGSNLALYNNTGSNDSFSAMIFKLG